jgi:hypothetical protein
MVKLSLWYELAASVPLASKIRGKSHAAGWYSASWHTSWVAKMYQKESMWAEHDMKNKPPSQRWYFSALSNGTPKMLVQSEFREMGRKRSDRNRLDKDPNIRASLCEGVPSPSLYSWPANQYHTHQPTKHANASSTPISPQEVDVNLPPQEGKLILTGLCRRRWMRCESWPQNATMLTA